MLGGMVQMTGRAGYTGCHMPRTHGVVILLTVLFGVFVTPEVRRLGGIRPEFDLVLKVRLPGSKAQWEGKILILLARNTDMTLPAKLLLLPCSQFGGVQNTAVTLGINML